MEIELVNVNWNQSFKFTSSTHKDNNKCSYTRVTAFLEQASISFLPCFLSLCRWSYLEIHPPPFKFFCFWPRWVFATACRQAFSSCESRGCSLVAVQWLLLPWSTGSGTGLRWLWRVASVAVEHVDSSQTREGTWVPCIGRQILNHWTTGEVLEIPTF